jgi:hypothetical protein
MELCAPMSGFPRRIMTGTEDDLQRRSECGDTIKCLAKLVLQAQAVVWAAAPQWMKVQFSAETLRRKYVLTGFAGCSKVPHEEKT